MNYEHLRHYARGWLLHFLGLPDRAYVAFAEAFRYEPTDAQAARHLAAISAEKQHWAAAEAWFATVVALAPEESDAWFNLGFVREHSGKLGEAIAAFRESVRLKPAQDRAWYGMGLNHARLGEHEAAALALREAIRLQPMNGEAYYQLGMALHHASQPDQVQAIVARLASFEPVRARRLVQDTKRPELMLLVLERRF
jgi:tetratricopeptide (TPR) repeat protein